MNEPVKFAGNDYLGLASHPEVIEALCRTARAYGVSSTSSRAALGWTDLHEQLERELADFMGTEDACILGAAYFGGALYFGRMAVADPPRRVVFCDETVHSNQYLGLGAAGCEVHTFRHLDADDLRRQVAGYSGPPAIIATDGVYGVSGEIAPVAEFAEIAARIDAELFVDDAHAVGVLGATGRGVTELAALRPDQATVLGSMSKAMGANGGFLAGRKELVTRFRASPEANGSAIPPPPIAAAALAALKIIRTDPEPRRRMEANATRMRRTLADEGLAVVSDRHPIVAMLLADEFEAADLSRHFLSHGLRIPYFKYASEPRDNLLRSAARAVYTDEHLDRFAQAVRTRPRR